MLLRSQHNELPQRQINLPQQHNKLPQRHNELPQQHNELPQRQIKLPQQHNELPERQNKLPQQHNELPQRHNELAQQHNKLPQQHNELPQQHNELPQRALNELNNTLAQLKDAGAGDDVLEMLEEARLANDNSAGVHILHLTEAEKDAYCSKGIDTLRGIICN